MRMCVCVSVCTVCVNILYNLYASSTLLPQLMRKQGSDGAKDAESSALCVIPDLCLNYPPDHVQPFAGWKSGVALDT